jgi:hypothetical protein
MYLEAMIEHASECTWSVRSSELRHPLGDSDRMGLVKYWETESSSELTDAFGGPDQTRLEENLEAVDLEVIDLNAVNLEEVNLEAVNLNGVNQEAVNLEAVDREACAIEAESLFIG